MILSLRVATIVVAIAASGSAMAQTAGTLPPQPPPYEAAPPPPPPATGQFSSNELVDTGSHFFGGVSRGLAGIVEKAVSQWGLPNGYILGEEASGAFVGGLRYGNGMLYTRNAGDLRVFWQGPSIGFDAGADGARTMMLVYNLPQLAAIFDRFWGINGSAYFEIQSPANVRWRRKEQSGPRAGRWMSALGNKTSRCVDPMSALPPKADIQRRERHVRFVPKTRHSSGKLR
jgi:hypothetical protein